MADETLELLTRFHREFRDEFATFRRDITTLVEGEVGSIRDEFTTFRRDIRDEFGTFRRDVVSLVQSEVTSVRSEVAELRGDVKGLRDDMLSHFDAIYERFDHLEKEYYMLLEAVRQLENRFETFGKGFADRQELEELKARVAELQNRIGQLESEL